MPTAVRRPAVEESTEDTTPVVGEVDVNALIAALQETQAKQQAYINQLLAEKGIPADPVAAKIQALQAHVAHHAGANPWHSESYDALRSHVDSLDSETLTSKQSAKAVRLVAQLQKKHPTHELAYVNDLASELHDMALDAEDEE